MLLGEQYGRTVTIAAVIANTFLAGAALWFAGVIYRVLGATGAAGVAASHAAAFGRHRGDDGTQRAGKLV